MENNNLNKDLKVLLVILLVNALFALIYFIWRMLKKDYKKGTMMTLLMLVAPVVGPIYLGLSALLYEVYFKHRTEILSLEDLSFSKDKIGWIEKDDLQAAANKVPLEEALLVSDVHSTRRLLMNVLKNDTQEYVRSINQATSNIDSEVSHYAATAITDIMNIFKQKEKKLKKRYENNPENEAIAEEYWNHINNFLETGVLPRVEQERYFKILEKLTMHLEEEMEELVTGKKYYELTVKSFRNGQVENAQFWTEKALENRENDLHSYKAGLKYYYEIEAFEQYKDLLAELKDSNIPLDQETLDLVRFYNYQ